MPSGFPAFRHDPTTAPRFIDRSSTSTSGQSRDASSDAKEGVKLSKYQYPAEKGEKSKQQSHPKVEGGFQKL